jgi:leucyl-tRNA synthetase
MRFKLNLSLSLTKKEIEDLVLENELSKKWMEGRMPKKTIVVPGKIINIVF